MKYPRAEDGEWIRPAPDGIAIGCCDCGLVHRMEFRIVRGRVQFRAFRANRSTAQNRRWHHFPKLRR